MWIRIPGPLFSAAIEHAVIAHADASYPHECIGFIVRRGGALFAMPLPAISSEQSCRVPAQVLIDAIYALDEAGVLVHAAYHSHPGGTPHLSALDHAFSLWSNVHLLAFRIGDAWSLSTFQWNPNILL